MKRQSILTSCAILVAIGMAASTQAGDPIVAGEQITIRSQVLQEDRQILISVPADYGSGANRYPVLYLLDGPANFGHTIGSKDVLARSNRMPQMIVVGIANTDRTRDMTPSPSSSPQFPTAGGADDFLQFISSELIPYIDQHYRTHPYRVLIGHSFGGLFAVHALVNEPDAFDAHIAISPSLHWDNGATVKQMETFLSENPDYRGFLYVTMANEGGPMQISYKSLVALLGSRAPLSLGWGGQLMLDEDHNTVVIRSTYHGLKELFADWNPRQIVASGDIDDICAHYAGLSEKYGYPIKPPELVINQLGYRAMQAGDPRGAIDIFKYNVEAYPDSANVYDSLGEAYENVNDLPLALENYAKAATQGKLINDANTAVYQTNHDRVIKLTTSRGGA